MGLDVSQPQDVDLDRTDRLPILEGVTFDDDVADDAVRLEYTNSLPALATDFPRPPGLDLPSLAESVRSVEERFARQAADYDVLNHSYVQSREAEAAASSRAQVLAADLAGVRATLDAEQKRSADMDAALAERRAAVESAHIRSEEARREAERHLAESHTLRDALAARDATLAEIQNSLRERDAQLVSLEREHAQIVPALEERAKVASRLEGELQAASVRQETLSTDLKGTRESVAALNVRMKASEAEVDATRTELGAARSQSTSYLEQLRTRDWRRGFDHNLFRELDAEIGVVEQGRGELQTERDRLRQRLSEIESRLSGREEIIVKLQDAAKEDESRQRQLNEQLLSIGRERDEFVIKLAGLESERTQLHDVLATQRDTIAKMKLVATADEAQSKKFKSDLQSLDAARAELTQQLGLLEQDRSRLNAELLARDAAIERARAAAAEEAERFQVALAAVEKKHSELAATGQRLDAEARAHGEEMAVLVAHLAEARKPILHVEATVKRLTEELAAKQQAFDASTEENRNLRLAVERTRGALEEREFLIRRLERSESNNANVLGRIQTSIERLGTSGTAAGSTTMTPGQAVELTAELVRLDGQHKTTHTLSRRTRIGRAPGCELQIDSSSVSRHHALMLLGPREVIVEDLNSTNGVLVNGRRVARQLLNDGDIVTIGEAQFRFGLTVGPRVLEAPPPDAAAR